MRSLLLLLPLLGACGKKWFTPTHAHLPEGWRLLNSGAFCMVECQLSPERSSELLTERGALVSWTGEIDLRPRVNLLGSLAGATSFMLQDVSLKLGETEKGLALLAPAAPGEVLVLDVAEGLVVADKAFLAAEAEVKTSFKLQGIKKTFFSNSGLAIMTLGPSGGKVMLTGFGTIRAVTLEEGETIRVDPKHAVAWTLGTEFKVVSGAGKDRGIISSFLAGETAVLKFYGPGTVYLSSHSVKRFAKTLSLWQMSFGSSGGRSSSSSSSSSSR